MPRLAPLWLVLAMSSVGCTQYGEVLTRSTPGASSNEEMLVSAGDTHTCALSDGELFCWGNNEVGQSGTLSNELSPAKLQASVDSRWISVTAGTEHTCALDDRGRVYCWGGNQRGQLGQGDRTPRATPTLVPLATRASQIATKFNHNCALLIDARLYCWGENQEGQLGQADEVPIDDETERDGLVPLAVGNGTWRAIDTGQGHTCGIALDGTMLCWGRNSEHELGVDERIQVREPTVVSDDRSWLSVSAGQHHNCALRGDLTIHCWGQNTASASNEGFPLGIAGATQIVEPTQISERSDWQVIATNTFHTCAVTRGNELLCWGRNVEGQLGLEEPLGCETPRLIGVNFSRISTGRFHTCVTTTNREVRCAGKNDDGQLGLGDRQDRTEFSKVTFVKPD